MLIYGPLVWSLGHGSYHKYGLGSHDARGLPLTSKRAKGVITKAIMASHITPLMKGRIYRFTTSHFRKWGSILRPPKPPKRLKIECNYVTALGI